MSSDDDERTKERKTTAVSPRPGLKCVSDVLEDKPFGVSGRSATREKGYDSGKVTGICDLVTVEDLVFAIALREAGVENSRYESRSLEVVSNMNTFSFVKSHLGTS